MVQAANERFPHRGRRMAQQSGDGKVMRRPDEVEGASNSFITWEAPSGKPSAVILPNPLRS